MFLDLNPTATRPRSRWPHSRPTADTRTHTPTLRPSSSRLPLAGLPEGCRKNALTVTWTLTWLLPGCHADMRAGGAPHTRVAVATGVVSSPGVLNDAQPQRSAAADVVTMGHRHANHAARKGGRAATWTPDFEDADLHSYRPEYRQSTPAAVDCSNGSGPSEHRMLPTTRVPCNGSGPSGHRVLPTTRVPCRVRLLCQPSERQTLSSPWRSRSAPPELTAAPSLPPLAPWRMSGAPWRAAGSPCTWMRAPRADGSSAHDDETAMLPSCSVLEQPKMPLGHIQTPWRHESCWPTLSSGGRLQQHRLMRSAANLQTQQDQQQKPELLACAPGFAQPPLLYTSQTPPGQRQCPG